MSVWWFAQLDGVVGQVHRAARARLVRLAPEVCAPVGHEQKRGRRRPRARLLREPPEHLGPVHALQLVVNEQEVWAVNAQEVQRVDGVEGGAHLEALGAQQQVDLRHARRVRDDEHQPARLAGRAPPERLTRGDALRAASPVRVARPGLRRARVGGDRA